MASGSSIAAKKRRERVYLRVHRGCLIPADNYAASRLRLRGYKLGDLLAADLTKPRNPKFNRLVHRIGQLIVANIDEFSGMDAHKALKRLQLEGNICCEELEIFPPGLDVGMRVKIPESLAFDNMDEGEFHEVALQFCRFVSDRYWPDCSPGEIERMAEAMIDD